MSSQHEPPPPSPVEHPEPLTPACAWTRAQAAPLALGMLDADEVGRVYDHLLLCPACDEAVQRLVSMTSLLGLAAVQVEPPPAARRALLARVAQEGCERQIAPARATPGARIAVLRWWQPAMAGNRWVAPLTVLVVLLLGGFGVQGAVTSSDEVVQLRLEKESMVAHLVSLSIGRQKFGSDALLYPLMAIHAGETGAGGVLLGDPSEPRASLSIWNLTERPGDYTVTVEGTDGSRSDAGAVTIDQRGAGTLDLHLFQPIVTYRVVHVATAGQPDVDVFTLRLDEGAGGSADILQQLGE